MDKVKGSLKYLVVFLAVLFFFSQALAESASQKEVTPRSKTQKLQVDGRVLLRFSESQNNGKTIYGDPGDGFIPRKVRVRFHGNLNKNLKYMIHLRADRGSNVELWDAFVVYKVNQLPVPVSIKAGLFKNPVSMSYLKPGIKLWFPERAVVVNKFLDTWRDTGIQMDVQLLKDKFIKKLTLVAAILNGEGWQKHNNKIYNEDDKWLYVFSLDNTLIDDKNFSIRVRAAHELGYDAGSKLIYYSVYNRKISNKTISGITYNKLVIDQPIARHLTDVEAQINIKKYGIVLEGGYMFDKSNARIYYSNSNGTQKNYYTDLGTASGWYAQVNLQMPVLGGLDFLKKLHLIGRYSEIIDVNDNDDKYDKNYEVQYASFGFYYLFKEWNSAIRGDYVIAGGDNKDNNLFCLEYQLLF